jgi:hypothetical protein
MEVRLASEREWPHPIWQDRFRDHPIGGLFGSRLIWTIRSPGSTVSAVPQGDHWLTIDGRQLDSDRLASSTLRLWHPADADDDTVMAWRATLASAGIRQPIRQVDREVFRPPDGDPGQAADRRFAGRIVDQAQMRALLRGRGWSVPALGSWDQGDEATASRAFDAGIHAELRYQAVGRAPASGPMERARLIGVRFVMEGPGDGGGSPARPGSDGSDRSGPSTRVLATVPPRVVSEALRDVSLVAIVGDRIAPEG